MKNLKLSILLLILNFNFKPVFSQVSTITYELTARNLSLEAVNSYPQKPISYQKNDTLYRIVVSTFGAWEDTVGEITNINEGKQCLTINVEMFGRETPVEIDFTDVKLL